MFMCRINLFFCFLLIIPHSVPFALYLFIVSMGCHLKYFYFSFHHFVAQLARHLLFRVAYSMRLPCCLLRVILMYARRRYCSVIVSKNYPDFLFWNPIYRANGPLFVYLPLLFINLCKIFVYVYLLMLKFLIFTKKRVRICLLFKYFVYLCIINVEINVANIMNIIQYSILKGKKLIKIIWN